MNSETTYVPGSCNLDRKAATTRRWLGILCLVAGSAGWYFLARYGLPFFMRYGEAFVFVGLTVLNFREASNRFCVFDGLSSIEETSGARKDISDPDSFRADLRRVRKELAIAAICGAIGGLIALIQLS
jgi:hypothetical protein